ncbi:MAG: hypothetical protein IJM76_08705 [Lachnospiraceae bacterium]|nr:hypothetical protein [Lachnospiraceae bacterium]
MKKAPFKKRFSYWFDKRMSKGSLGLIRLLAILTLFVILIVAFVIFRLAPDEEGGFLSSFWESLSTVINAWMPAYEDGGGSMGYLIPMSIAAIVGLLITSVLIGIISSAIEEKITSLKRGTSEVIEEGHIVVVGFYPGEYTLLRQLVLSTAEKPLTIVVAADMEQEEMQEYISENVEHPKNVEIICRTADIFDPKALARCAVTSARSVIISPTDDFSTTKALLAVSSIIHGSENKDVRVGAIVSKEEYSFPPSIAAQHNVTTLKTELVLAKIIAHSCTQPGLSDTFREMFNFEGSELYTVALAGAEGLSFEELMLRTDGGVPVGIADENGIRVNPAADTVVKPGERVLVFAEESDSARLVPMPELKENAAYEGENERERPAKVTFLGGGGRTLRTVLRNLPENVTEVVLPVGSDLNDPRLVALAEKYEFRLSLMEEDISEPEGLEALARVSEHIVILSDHDKSEDEADMDSIFLLMNLRDIRNRLGLKFNITAEMRKESNQSLIVSDDRTDYVVASNMSSLFLAQLSESPELMDAFSELLSNAGNELYLKEAPVFGLAGTFTTAEIRRRTLERGYVFIGYLPEGAGASIFNPGLAEEITLGEKDQLIVFGED